MTRFAIVANVRNSRELIALLPDNYHVRHQLGEREWLIAGEDDAGWTLDGYVMPRIGSANLTATEVPAWHWAAQMSAADRHLDPAELGSELAQLGPDTIAQVNAWLARGDGIAVYENADLGHRELGHRQYLSYGSPAAQLEVETPPTRLPDIGGRINWRYQLVGVHRGTPLANVLPLVSNDPTELEHAEGRTP